MNKAKGYRRQRRTTPAKDARRIAVFMEPSLVVRLKWFAESKRLALGPAAERVLDGALVEVNPRVSEVIPS